MVEQITLKSWGNSFGIRIPKKIMESMKLKQEDILEMETTEDSIIIRKAFQHKTFEERLAQYNGDISVNPFEWGEPVGREMI